jgi:adenylate cyclase
MVQAVMAMTGRALQTLVALALTAVWGASLGYIHWQGTGPFVDRAESAMTDLRTLAIGERPAPDVVTIVAIDDETVRRQGRFPLPRSDLAKIVDGIAQLQPAAIAVDLLLVDRTQNEDDATLAHAFDRRPTAIAAAAIFAQATQSVDVAEGGPLADLPRAERFLLPLQDLADHAAIGVVNITTDQSGTPRAVPMLFRTGDRIEMSLPLRIAALATNSAPSIEPDRLVLAGRSIATDIDHLLPLSFYGRRGTIQTVSAASALDGTLPPDAIRGRVVVIGATVTGGGDVFPTPFDPVMPGVEVVATAMTHLMTGDGLRRDRSLRLADAVLAVVLALMLIGLLAWRHGALGLVGIVAILLIWLAGNFAAFAHGLWLSASLPVAAAAPPAILFGAVQLWQNRLRAQRLAVSSDLLQQFQAPVMREWLERNPGFLIEPVHQQAAVVFIDLSGFTSLSETLSADTVQAMLKDFHALVDAEAVKRGGFITSFLGDGAMILFGLPEPGAADAANAVLCCVALCQRSERWLASLPPSIAARTGFKIGAHFGAIVASRLGGGSFAHITATGDTVNVASRLMEVAASHGAALALSDDLLRHAGPNSTVHARGFLTGPRDAPIRGRSADLAVWLWRDEAGASPDPQDL